MRAHQSSSLMRTALVAAALGTILPAQARPDPERDRVCATAPDADGACVTDYLYRRLPPESAQAMMELFEIGSACPAQMLMFDHAGLSRRAGVGATSCGRRDLDATIAIEEHGAANDVPSERLYNAVETQVEARRLCDAGRVEEAMALYDGIVSMGRGPSPGDRLPPR